MDIIKYQTQVKNRDMDIIKYQTQVKNRDHKLENANKLILSISTLVNAINEKSIFSLFKNKKILIEIKKILG